MLELTEEQQQALTAEPKGLLRLVDPRTRQVFVLIRQEIYDRACTVISGPNRRGWDDPELDVYEEYRKKP